jgi:uncharacterized protein YpiB (UPF0302 family)
MFIVTFLPENGRKQCILLLEYVVLHEDNMQECRIPEEKITLRMKLELARKFSEFPGRVLNFDVLWKLQEFKPVER